MRFTAEAEIRAPAAVVFDVVSTPERLPEWNPSVRRARRHGDAPVGPGTRAVFLGRLLGQEIESETEVVRFERPQWFATRGVRGPRLTTTFRLESQPFGSRIAVVVEGQVPGGMMGAFIAERVLTAELRRSLDLLRGICEAEARRGAPADTL